MISRDQQLEKYILAYTSPESESLRAIDRLANIRLMRPRMLSGHLQGQLLKMLCAITGVRTILEIGTYAAYASVAMAEALPYGGVIHTIEIDDEMEHFIREAILLSGMEDKIYLHIGRAEDLVPKLWQQYDFDMVYIDANKRDYIAYYELVVSHIKPNKLIAVDNTLWDGKVIEPIVQSDKQTQGIIAFNDYVRDDDRVEQVLLPLRDGLTLIRKV